MSDPVFDYNMKVFDAIFGGHPDIARDEKIAANEQRRRDADESEEIISTDFEAESGARR